MVPVSRVHLHGAAVHPDNVDGPFLAQPSKRTLDKEHPPPWSPPRTRPQTVVDEGRRRASVPEYTAKTPWPEKTFRPATAGRKHEQPTWYPTPSIQYVIVKSIARRCLCLLLLVRDLLFYLLLLALLRARASYCVSYLCAP
jgi:hypothetical protein